MSNNISILKEKIKGLPIGVMATLLSVLTLSNIFATLGFNSLKHIVMNLGIIVIIFGFLKLILYPKQVADELNDTSLASIYPTFCMSMMLIASYYVKYNYILGKSLWLFAIVLNTIIILIFVYNNLIKKFEYAKFLPTFWVAFVGIIVSVITSPAMNSQTLATCIFYFSTIAYFIILPFMIYRLWTKPVADAPYPTLCVMSAPPSLCLVAYLTLFKEPNICITLFLYLIVFVATIYMYTRFPKIFSMKFIPTFAGITFPLAISTLATFKVASFLDSIGKIAFANLLKEIGSLELIVACAGISFVVYNFTRVFLSIFKSENA